MEVAPQGELVEVRIANTGRPLEVTVESLFQPFTRAHSSVEGTGLGLYIVDGIARAHGGTVKGSSSPSRTCFTMALPVDVWFSRDTSSAPV